MRPRKVRKMKDPEYFVYYDRGDTRPRKSFGRDGRAAMDWATTHASKDTEVFKCQSVWSARDAKRETS
jgi:hypothetical protein